MKELGIWRQRLKQRLQEGVKEGNSAVVGSSTVAKVVGPLVKL